MKGIIFDFDDTLVETTIYFDQAKDKFGQKMNELGFPVEEALDTLNKFDIKNVLNCGGFLKDCFPKALVETYDHYCFLHSKERCDQTASWMEQLGWEVFEAPVIVINGADKVAEELARDFPLYLATKGDTETQLKRLEQSGLFDYFKKIYVVPDKTHIEYKRIALENKLDPAQSWVIGNSMKGDINPALKTGFNCIHVYHSNTWDFEDEPPVGNFFSAKSITEVPKIIKEKG